MNPYPQKAPHEDKKMRQTGTFCGFRHFLIVVHSSSLDSFLPQKSSDEILYMLDNTSGFIFLIFGNNVKY